MKKASRRFLDAACMGFALCGLLMLTILTCFSSTVEPWKALLYGAVFGFDAGVVAMVLVQDFLIWRLGTTKTPPVSEPDSPALSRARLAGFAWGFGAFAAIVGLGFLYFWSRTWA